MEFIMDLHPYDTIRHDTTHHDKYKKYIALIFPPSMPFAPYIF